MHEYVVVGLVLQGTAFLHQENPSFAFCYFYCFYCLFCVKKVKIWKVQTTCVMNMVYLHLDCRLMDCLMIQFVLWVVLQHSH